jgi:hypothetical protein
MRVSSVREHYSKLTAKGGDVARQIAFAGIAVAWIFHIADPAHPNTFSLPPHVLLSVVLLCSGLGFDLLQYVISSAIWGVYGRAKEKEFQRESLDPAGESGEFAAPFWLNWPAIGFLWAKFLSIVAGMSVLCAHLWSSLQH